MLGAAGAAAAVSAQTRRKPNFLFLIADDHAGYVLGADGNRQAETPNLDKLFDRGLISFCVDGGILISKLLSPADCHALGVRSAFVLRQVPDRTRTYLARHVSEGHFRP